MKNAFELAQRYIGVAEVAGVVHNPAILQMLRLDESWPESDEVPWCSAFANFIAFQLRLPRSKSLRARSWLGVGVPITLEQGRAVNDVVILKQAHADPGPELFAYRGHVGFFGALDGGFVHILGGNQGDRVQVQAFDLGLVLGVRRLA